MEVVNHNLLKRYLNNARHFLQYGFTIPFYLKYKNFNYTSENTIAVFAQPRGGSTWFTDLLLRIPRTAKVDGPLYQGPFLPDGKMSQGKAAKLKSYSKLGFYFHQYIPETEDYPEAQAFFHRLFSHHFFTPYIYQETPLPQLFFAEKFIFKFYQGNLLLPWIVRNFNIKPILFLRNPYAVVASQIQYYAFRDTIRTGGYVLPEFRFSTFFEPYKEIIRDVKEPEEILAAMWCLNYVPVITHKENNTKWLTISYEGLLLHREREVDRLFHYLGEQVPDEFKDIYHRSSKSTTKTSLTYENKEDHLVSWKQVLTKAQVNNITAVLDRFGVKGYAAHPEPDYDYIYNFKTAQ